jgi:hypothetical protein
MNAPAMDTPTDFHFLERRMICHVPKTDGGWKNGFGAPNTLLRSATGTI